MGILALHKTPAVRQERLDGYVNMLNKYGTPQDNSTAYQYQHDGLVPDMYLTEQYETNGLFSKIIDTPAEEAVKHGFDLGLKTLILPFSLDFFSCFLPCRPTLI